FDALRRFPYLWSDRFRRRRSTRPTPSTSSVGPAAPVREAEQQPVSGGLVLPPSVWQVALQPSPAAVLPSSHCSPGSTVPLPQVPGARFATPTMQTSSTVQPPNARP